MPPSVTRGFTVPHIPTSKNSEDPSRPSTTINRPRSAKPTRINTSSLDPASYLDPAWQASTPLQRKYPVLTRQSQRDAMSSHPTLPTQPVPPSPSIPQVSPPPPSRSRQPAHDAPPSMPQPPARPIQQLHQQTPPVSSPHQQVLPAHAQPQRNPHLSQVAVTHGQLAQPISQQQQRQQQQPQQHPRAYMASRPPHHNMYAHPQQIPPQQIRQQHVPPQPHVSRPSRPSRPELVTSQHMVSARQIQSHQAVQQHQKPTVPQHAQQYMDVHQMNQDAQHQQLQQQYHGARMQNPQAQLTQMPSSNSPYPLATSKTDLAQRYQQPVQAAHHTQQKGQKVGIQHGRVAAVHQQQIPAQQAHQGQQAMSQQMHMARRSTAASNVNHISVMRGANIHNGQLYPAGLGLPASAMQSANIQYPPSYTSTGLFDPLNLNPAGIPLSSVGVSQPATNQAVNVARDLERQGQNSQLPQGVARSGVHVHERNGVTAQDIQSYADQGQAQLLHRPGGHSTPQDFQDQAVSQHHVQTGLYQPVEQQQNTPHLVLNQGTGLAPPQGSVVVHTQPSQIPQASAAADDQLNQQVYQNSAQNQLPGVAAGDGQQVGDLSSRKAAVPTTQQELLQWHGSGPNSRAVNNGLSQQPNGVATGTVSGPIITQSHLLDMGVPNARHPRQNSIAQISQLTGIQATSDQRNGSQKRQLPASGDEGSPRKRRQLGPGTPSPLESSRTYPCSGCGQDFARKRDRDNHVRTVHERSFRCSKCESRFKTKSDANRHVRIVHDRVRPYQCPSCPSMFSERNKLRRHKETVHEKRRPFVCPVCSSRFGELGNLRQHTGSLHPEYQSGSGSNPGRSRVNHQVQS